jgi:phosphatidylserine decarboxylase
MRNTVDSAISVTSHRGICSQSASNFYSFDFFSQTKATAMKDRWNYIGYAPEAWVLPTIAFVIITAAFGISKWSWVYVAIMILMLSFYRGRDWHMGLASAPPAGPNDLVSPCDGKVIRVVEHADALQIAIFLNVHNIHVQYAPIEGRIISSKHKPGEFVPAYMFEKSQYNERVETEMETFAGRVKVVQIAGLVARRIVPFHPPGTRLNRGDPLGLIKFGSRVDVWIPKASIRSVTIRRGDRVRIGQPMLILQRSLGKNNVAYDSLTPR